MCVCIYFMYVYVYAHKSVLLEVIHTVPYVGIDPLLQRSRRLQSDERDI